MICWMFIMCQLLGWVFVQGYLYFINCYYNFVCFGVLCVFELGRGIIYVDFGREYLGLSKGKRRIDKV